MKNGGYIHTTPIVIFTPNLKVWLLMSLPLVAARGYATTTLKHNPDALPSLFLTKPPLE